MEHTTDVTILGGRYTIKSAFEPKFVERTADLVNKNLNDIIKDGDVISTDKVAILACMTIASELLKLQEENQSLKTKLTKRLEKILSQIDTCLTQEDISYLATEEKRERTRELQEV